MNEWSPGGNYSRPGTPNQNLRSFRCQQDELLKGTKPHVNMRTPEGRSRNFQQHSMEDVSRGMLSASSKKGGGTGSSDPRFKRVLPLSEQNDACVGTDVKNLKTSLPAEVKETAGSKFPIWNAPEFKPNKSWNDCIKSSEETKVKLKGNELGCENLTAPEDSNMVQSEDNLKAVDKLSFDHNIVEKSVCKESDSECTVNTRNTSLVSEEFPQEYSNRLVRVPSTGRFKKVESWIQDQGPKLEKKHSVITVIGQMQEPETLSSALQEIDKRRKLVKELDRYAVCKKIIEVDKEKEISDLIGKISALSNKETILFNGSNETLNTNSNSNKDYGSKLNRHSELSNTENTVSKYNDLNVDSSIAVSRKSSERKKLMKSQSNSGCPVKGKLKMLVRVLPYQKMFCILIIMSGILSWFAFFSIQKGSYISFDLFSSKPKPLTWYERLCSWIWEFFRPSNNYHRATQWSSY